MRSTLPSVHKRRKVVRQLIVRGEYREYLGIRSIQEFYGMWKGAILPLFIYLQKPNDSCKQDNWRLHEEITRLLNPRAVQIEHDGVAGWIIEAGGGIGAYGRNVNQTAQRGAQGAYTGGKAVAGATGSIAGNVGGRIKGALIKGK